MKTFLKKHLMTIIGTVISLGMVAFFCIENGIENLITTFARLDPLWLLAAMVCMFLYWVFEAAAMHVLVRHIYPERSFWRTLRIAMVGQLYNAITPFASGGQPMQIYEMTVNDHMSTGSATSIVTRKSLVFQLGIVVFAVASLTFAYNWFSSNINGFVLLTAVGLTLNILYLFALMILSRSKRLTRAITGFFVKLLSKLRLLKDPQKAYDKVENQLTMFHESGRLFATAHSVTTISSLFTLLQLFFYFLIPYCVYRCFGLIGAPVMLMVAAGAYVYMVSCFMPLPGGSGAAESSFYMLFLLFFSNTVIAPAMLLWRTITYYSCLIVGAISMASQGSEKKKKKTGSAEY